MTEDDLDLIDAINAEQNVEDAATDVEPVVEPATPEEKPLTSTTLAEALKQVFPQQQQPVVKQEPVKLTPEQFRQRYKVVDPSDDIATAIASGDIAKIKSALTTLRDQWNEQSIAMNYDITQQQLTPFQKHIESLTESQQEQVRTQSRAQFFDKYPHFKGKEPILNAVTSALTASGQFNPANMDDAHKQIAQKADEMMKLVDPNYVAPTQNQQQKTKPTTQTKMASTSRGGQGGTGGEQTAASKPLGIAIFD